MSIHVGILTFPSVQQLDLTGPYEVFSSTPGCQAHLLWKDRNPVLSSTGLVLTPTKALAECPPLDVLCIPGGSGVNALLEDEDILSFVRHQAGSVRYITSVCTGALVLGAAGLLKGKRATTHWNAHDLLGHFGAIPVQGRVVRDGNLITAGGVTAGIDFGLTLIAELFGKAAAEIVQLSLEYAPEPPFHSGTPFEAAAEILAMARNRLRPSREQRETVLARLAKSA